MSIFVVQGSNVFIKVDVRSKQYESYLSSGSARKYYLMNSYHFRLKSLHKDDDFTVIL